MKKNILCIFCAIIASIIVFLGGILVSEKVMNMGSDSQKAQVINIADQVKGESTSSNLPKSTTLVFLGDMMLDRGVETSVKNNFNGDFNKLFENIPEIKNADILFANLEGPASDQGNNVGSKYSFRMDPSILTAIKEASFDIVSFANNHVGDWNVNAFKDTLTRLSDIGIYKTGAGINKTEAETPTIIEKNGVKFGFLGFSDVGPAWMEAKENGAGILLASDPNLPNIIQNAKAQLDVLIVSFHFGEEYKTIHNTRQEQLAKKAIDNGADMIIGHHPHVMEDIGEYKGKPIVYSLGNFIFDQYFSPNTMKGMLYEVTFNDKEIVKTESKIITLNKKYQPEGIFSVDDVIKNKKEITTPKKVITFTCPKPEKEYEDMWLLPIGQNTGLPDITYIPKNLEKINKEISTINICITKETNNNLEKMLEKAKTDGYSIKVSSGFRTYDTQKSLLSNAIKNGNINADVAIAKAGYSEHQLGTTVDITGKSIGYASASDKFTNSEEDIWMKENASDYGFIESYPLGKENITGYMYEPWHYRYAGIENAKEIIKSGQTINEYLGLK